MRFFKKKKLITELQILEERREMFISMSASYFRSSNLITESDIGLHKFYLKNISETESEIVELVKIKPSNT